jgi:hypothetical protein
MNQQIIQQILELPAIDAAFPLQYLLEQLTAIIQKIVGISSNMFGLAIELYHTTPSDRFIYNIEVNNKLSPQQEGSCCKILVQQVIKNNNINNFILCGKGDIFYTLDVILADVKILKHITKQCFGLPNIFGIKKKEIINNFHKRCLEACDRANLESLRFIGLYSFLSTNYPQLDFRFYIGNYCTRRFISNTDITMFCLGDNKYEFNHMEEISNINRETLVKQLEDLWKKSL